MASGATVYCMFGEAARDLSAQLRSALALLPDRERAPSIVSVGREGARTVERGGEGQEVAAVGSRAVEVAHGLSRLAATRETGAGAPASLVLVGYLSCPETLPKALSIAGALARKPGGDGAARARGWSVRAVFALRTRGEGPEGSRRAVRNFRWLEAALGGGVIDAAVVVDPDAAPPARDVPADLVGFLRLLADGEMARRVFELLGREGSDRAAPHPGVGTFGWARASFDREALAAKVGAALIAELRSGGDSRRARAEAPDTDGLVASVLGAGEAGALEGSEVRERLVDWLRSGEHASGPVPGAWLRSLEAARSALQRRPLRAPEGPREAATDAARQVRLAEGGPSPVRRFWRLEAAVSSRPGGYVLPGLLGGGAAGALVAWSLEGAGRWLAVLLGALVGLAAGLVGYGARSRRSVSLGCLPLPGASEDDFHRSARTVGWREIEAGRLRVRAEIREVVEDRPADPRRGKGVPSAPSATGCPEPERTVDRSPERGRGPRHGVDRYLREISRLEEELVLVKRWAAALPAPGGREAISRLFQRLGGARECRRLRAELLERLRRGEEGVRLVESVARTACDWSREAAASLPVEELVDVLEGGMERLQRRLEREAVPLWPLGPHRGHLLWMFGAELASPRAASASSAPGADVVALRLVAGVGIGRPSGPRPVGTSLGF